MEHLYAPWRGTYSTKAHTDNISKTPFCDIIASDNDTENFVLKRLEHTFIMLNIYPYNPGHLLVLPYEHVDSIDKLNKETRAELMEAINLCVTVLQTELKATGVNVGFNLGDHASGGSIPDHLHAHIVPRWKGDTNFLPVICEVKPLSSDLQLVYKQLKSAFSTQ